jgi:hypothetical protein
MPAWMRSIRLSTQGTIYPCHTINAANADSRLRHTLGHLLDIQRSDGGWRCNKFSFGRGPETDFSNPGPTLIAVDAFRFTDFLNKERVLDRAVGFLLDHWTTHKPLGPCHYGMGTLFMQVEYPFGNHNIFPYVYVLSFYDRAKEDERFREALSTLESRLVDGKLVVERTSRKLAGLAFC